MGFDLEELKRRMAQGKEPQSEQETGSMSDEPASAVETEMQIASMPGGEPAGSEARLINVSIPKAIMDRVGRLPSLKAAHDFMVAHRDDSNRAEIDAAVESRIMRHEIIGDGDTYHNVAVEFSRHQVPSAAINTCNAGLTLFPGNVDLLADLILYARNHGDTAAARKNVKRLKEVVPDHKKWNFRCYHFTLDQLLEDQQPGYEDEVRELVAELKRYIPHDEKAYESEAMLSEINNDMDRAIQVLEEGISLIPVASGCAMTLAELYMKRGEYLNAIRVTTYGIAAAAETQPSANVIYLIYMRALSYDSLLQRRLIKADSDIDYREIDNLLNEYDIVRKFSKNPTYLNNLEQRCALLRSMQSSSGMYFSVMRDGRSIIKGIDE